MSIKTSLKNIANLENIKYQSIITRYFHERLLYRIAVSEHVNHFFLKGGNLLYAIEGLHVRPTTDLDMSAKHIENDKVLMQQIFQDICNARYDDDCVVFDTENIETTNIAENTKYGGVRVLIDARLDTIRQRLQIDIGFGDVITPAPVDLTYPVLLNELAKPEIRAYSIETVIAEKFHAMVVLGTLNSRMKDFYDVYVLLKNNDVNSANLKEAILRTFKHRNTDFVKEHELFSRSFGEDPKRRIMWNTFLRKMDISDDIAFPFVVKNILERLSPVCRDLSREDCDLFRFMRTE